MKDKPVQIGDNVWFTDKYGDRVEGIYAEDTTAPILVDDKMVDMPFALVKSHYVLGRKWDTPVPCIVRKESLKHVE